MSVAKDVADNAASAVTEAEAAAAKDTNGDEGTPVLAKTIVKKRSEKEKADRVKDEVERYCEKFEKEVLRLFDRSYRKGDPRMMAVSYGSASRRQGADGVSIAQRHYRILMEAHPAYRSMSINTTFSFQKTAY
jgi:hypothetical protein